MLRMRQFFYSTSALLAVALAGCQAIRDPVLSHSVPIYATNADARAVATGKFGAMPIEISNESELEVLATACGSATAQVRLRSGKVGWIPEDSLPPTLRDCKQ